MPGVQGTHLLTHSPNHLLTHSPNHQVPNENRQVPDLHRNPAQHGAEAAALDIERSVPAVHY